MEMNTLAPMLAQTLMDNVTSTMATRMSSDEQAAILERMRIVYQWMIPAMIFILVFAILGNLVIVLSAPFLTVPVSPYLKLCISLAAADMWAATLLIAGLLVNSYLPVVFGVKKTSQCPEALLEMFRISGMLTSGMHLFLLALNQFFGTIWPLRYKIMATTRRIRAMVFCLWVVPFLFVLCWFVANEDDGLRHESCQFRFYGRSPFRKTIFLTFILPLAATFLIYLVIMFNLLKAKAEFENSVHDRRMSTTRRSNVQSKLKLVRTTLLIVLSFLLTWGLCVLYFVLVCAEGCVFIYGVSLSYDTGLLFSSTVNCLVMIKLAANPFIYTLRIKAIHVSVRQLINSACRRRTFPTAKNTKANLALLSSSPVPSNV